MQSVFCMLTGVKFSCCAEIVFFRATSTAVYLWPLTQPTKSNTTSTWRTGVTLCFFSCYSLPFLSVLSLCMLETLLNCYKSTYRCHQLHINISFHSRYTFYHSNALLAPLSTCLSYRNTDEKQILLSFTRPHVFPWHRKPAVLAWWNVFEYVT